MRISGTRTDGRFLAGFISAALLIAGFILLTEAVRWLTSNPQPQALFEFLREPLFSLMDVFTVGLILLIIAVILVFPRYMPYGGRQ